MSSTRALDGPDRQKSIMASTASAGPSKTASTAPSERFVTDPETPRDSASRRVESRKNTPCTSPRTTTLLRTSPSAIRPADRRARRSLDHHPERPQPPVARAAKAAAELERPVDVVERLRRQDLAGEHVGDAGGIGGERLGCDPPDRLLHRYHLLRREERLAGPHDELAPGRRRREVAAGAATRTGARAERIDGVAQSSHQPPSHLERPLPHPEHPDDHVLAGELEVHVGALAQERR